ncbi:hypothetical protein RHS01_01119 [Rhizoctonia solani]|uniref:CCHC-type domain-containing protein n=1 Tax=Rhizoctonia solani TaxID=456999 RepID=A0A8H7MA76_9AGAM|nr:hypothetical protein RHS01_01119 [Rhizoctonia solani]
MDLDWNNAAPSWAICTWPPLGGQPPHCHSRAAPNYPPGAAERSPGPLTTPSARSVPATRLRVATRPGRLSSNPNFVSKEERNRRRAKGLCIKCGKLGHKFAECRTGWKATPKEESVKKEAAKVGEESGPKSGKD